MKQATPKQSKNTIKIDNSNFIKNLKNKTQDNDHFIDNNHIFHTNTSNFTTKIKKNTQAEQEEEQLLLDTAILAGKIMMENGAEMHRVEDTMERIIETSTEYEQGISFALPTGIFIATQQQRKMRMARIHSRANNLNKIHQVNSLSRQFTAQKINLTTFFNQLIIIEKERPPYTPEIKVIASALISITMMLLLGGDIKDCWVTGLAGAFGYCSYLMTATYLPVRFLPDFFAAFLIGVIIQGSSQWFNVLHPDMVLTGALMTLVPGVPITNAIRDFFAGNTVSGTVFGIEAVWIAVMIATGVTCAFQLF